MLKIIIFLMIFTLLNMASVTGEDPPKITHIASDVGGVIPHSYLETNITSSKKEINRSESIAINYSIISVSLEEVDIVIPDEFENPIIDSNLEKEKIVKYGNNQFKLVLGGSTKTKFTHFGYKAKISNTINIKNNKYKIILSNNTIKSQYGIAEAKIIPCSILIHNNIPKSKLRFARLSEYESYSFYFRDEILNLLLEGNDVEDQYLTYEILDEDGSVFKRGILDSLNASSSRSVSYTLKNKSNMIRFIVFDNDNASSQDNISISTIDESIGNLNFAQLGNITRF